MELPRFFWFPTTEKVEDPTKFFDKQVELWPLEISHPRRKDDMSTLALGLGLGAAGLGVTTLFCLRRHWAKVGGRKLSHGAPGRKFIRVWGKNAVKSPDALEDERKSGESAAEEAAAAL